jgi:guanylate kinase
MGCVCRSATYNATVPYTTRPPRDGEVDRVDYNFISLSQFKHMQNAGRFVEWGERQGVLYGTATDAPAIKPTGFARRSSRTVRAMAKVGPAPG